MRIGDVAFATNPFELYLDYAVRIRELCKATQTFLIQKAGCSGTHLPSERSIAHKGCRAVPASTNADNEGGNRLVDWTMATINRIDFLRLNIRRLPHLGQWINAACDDCLGICLRAGNMKDFCRLMPCPTAAERVKDFSRIDFGWLGRFGGDAEGCPGPDVFEYVASLGFPNTTRDEVEQTLRSARCRNTHTFSPILRNASING